MKWPRANVGVLLGQSSGLVDFECDAPEAEEHLQQLFGGELPDGPRFQSSRGTHYLFAWRDDLPRKATVRIGKLDIKLGYKGSQSVFPPSRHASGKKYEWIVSPVDCELPKIPDSVVKRINRETKRDRVSSIGRPERGGTIPEGHRNTTLYKLACSHAEKTDMPAIVQRENSERCQPPLDDAEVFRIIESSKRYAREVPSAEITGFRKLARNHPELRPPVIDGLLRQGEVANIIAKSKSAKSWTAYGLALSVIAGGEWLGRFACTAGRVLLIDGELHPETLAHRIPLVAQSMQIVVRSSDGRRRPSQWEKKLDILSLRGQPCDVIQLERLLEDTRMSIA